MRREAYRSSLSASSAEERRRGEKHKVRRMCLIAFAHRASERFPFVLAANRDEDYTRATHDAHFWSDAPVILGGRDALHGGSWLAVSRGGRFAAVTNLRGAVPRGRSRGALLTA